MVVGVEGDVTFESELTLELVGAVEEAGLELLGNTRFSARCNPTP